MLVGCRRWSRLWLSPVPCRSNCDVAVRRRRPVRSSTMSGGSGRPTATFPMPRCDTTGQDVALPALASSGTTVVAFGDLARVKGRTQFSMVHHVPCGELACGAALWRLLQLFQLDGLPGRSVVAAHRGVEGLSMRNAPIAARRVLYAGGPAMSIQGVATVVAGECRLGRLPIGPKACPQSSLCFARPGTRPQVLGLRRAYREPLRRDRATSHVLPVRDVRRACSVHAPDAERAARREGDGTARAHPTSLEHRSEAGVARPATSALCHARGLNGSQSMKLCVTSRDVAQSRLSLNGRQMSSRGVERTAGAARIDGLTYARVLKRCACNSPTSGPWAESCAGASALRNGCRSFR